MNSNDDREDNSSSDALDDCISGNWDKIAGGAEDIAELITSRDKIKDRDFEPLPVIEGEGWTNLVTDPEREAPAPREAALEKVMRTQEAKLAEREITTRQFSDAKPWRDEARRIGIEPADLLEQFLKWDDLYDADPVAAADAFAATGFRLPVHLIEDGSAKEPPKDTEEPVHPSRAFDDAFEAAWRGDAKREAQEFAPTAEQWKKLQAKYPGETLDSVMRRSVEIIKDLSKSPWETAARVAAAKGMPITPAQQELAEEQQQQAAPVVDMVTHYERHLPGVSDMYPDMEKVLARREFVRSGNLENDFLRAYEIVRIGRAELARMNAERSKPKPRGGLDGQLDRAFAQVGA